MESILSFFTAEQVFTEKVSTGIPFLSISIIIKACFTEIPSAKMRKKQADPVMRMEEAFKLAQSDTKFIKERKNLLYTFGATRLPYVCVSQDAENADFVTVRSGEVLADKPQIAVPGEMFSFEGFEELREMIESEPFVALARRISIPPSKYVNRPEATERRHGPMADELQRIVSRLENDNDVRTGVISAPERVWTLSVLLYVGSQVARSAESNVQEHFEHMRLRGHS